MTYINGKSPDMEGHSDYPKCTSRTPLKITNKSKKFKNPRSIKNVPPKCNVKLSPTEPKHAFNCGFGGLIGTPRKSVKIIKSPKTMDRLGGGKILPLSLPIQYGQ